VIELNKKEITDLFNALNVKDSNEPIDWKTFSVSFNRFVDFDGISIYQYIDNNRTHLYSSTQDEVQLLQDLTISGSGVNLDSNHLLVLNDMKKPIVIDGHIYKSFMSIPFTYNSFKICTINICTDKEDYSSQQLHNEINLFRDLFSPLLYSKTHQYIKKDYKKDLSIDKISAEVNELKDNFKKIHDLIDFLSLASNTIDRNKISKTLKKILNKSKDLMGSINNIEKKL
tara:strand:+ start:22 stop:705 length:684 start_codon:yes stop_codon:yes gene_type:complete